jgi:hypothetical protein
MFQKVKHNRSLLTGDGRNKGQAVAPHSTGCLKTQLSTPMKIRLAYRGRITRDTSNLDAATEVAQRK